MLTMRHAEKGFSNANSLCKSKNEAALGSLLVFYQTTFKGGAATLRYGGGDSDEGSSDEYEHVFDACRSMSTLQEPCVAYIAFLHSGLRGIKIAPFHEGCAVCL